MIGEMAGVKRKINNVSLKISKRRKNLINWLGPKKMINKPLIRAKSVMDLVLCLRLILSTLSVDFEFYYFYWAKFEIMTNSNKSKLKP